MEPKKSEKSSLWSQIVAFLTPQHTLSRTALGIATFAFLFIVTGAMTGLNISFDNSGIQLGFGASQSTEKTFTATQVEQIVQQIQRDNVALVEQVVAEAQERQNEQLDQTFASFASYLETQRTNDLTLISSGLEDLKENTFTRFQQNEQVLGEIIQTVSYRN